MNTAAIRRRYYGGESTPVMEIIHPDAIYFKTNEYAAPDSPYIWQWGIRISEMTKVIVDGAEVNPGDAFTELYNGANLQPILSGVHEYYVYWNHGRRVNINLQAWNPISIIRFERNSTNNISKVTRRGNNRPLDIMFIDNSIPSLSDVILGNNNLYVPVGSKSNVDIGSGNIIEVKYKIIED